MLLCILLNLGMLSGESALHLDIAPTIFTPDRQQSKTLATIDEHESKSLETVRLPLVAIWRQMAIKNSCF